MNVSPDFSPSIKIMKPYFMLSGFFSSIYKAHLIEEQEVPMLHELIPKKITDLQFIFSSIGLVISMFGMLISTYSIFYTGALFLIIGAIPFFISIYKMFERNL